MAETIKAARRRLEHTQSQPQEQDDGEAEPEPDKELLEGWGGRFFKMPHSAGKKRNINHHIGPEGREESRPGRSAWRITETARLPAIENILRGMGRDVRRKVDDRDGGGDGTQDLASLAEG